MLIPVFVHHTCVPSFSAVLLQIILPAHSKGLWFDNHSFSPAELYEKTWKRHISFFLFFFIHLEMLPRLWRELKNVCINLCLSRSLSLSLFTDTPQKDGEDGASSSDSASDSASSLFSHWGHDLGPESRRVALKKFRYFGYNGYLSDRISLTRPIPDLRPDGSVIWLGFFFLFCFMNEPWCSCKVLIGNLQLSLSSAPQVQKHVIFIRPSTAQRHLHLCQRGLISVAALRPHGHPEDSTAPAQRDHTGGWPQQQP